MKISHRILLPLLISVPILVAGLLSFEPRPLALTVTWHAARLAAAQEKYADAVALYRKIIEFQPERIDLWETIGNLAYQAGDFEGSIEAYHQAEAAGLISIDGRFNLGGAYRNLGEIELARQQWRRLAELPGLIADQYAELVSFQRQYGDFEGALLTAEKWHNKFPGDNQASYAYGLHLSYIDPERAREVLMPVSAADAPEAEKSLALLQGIETAILAGHAEYGLVVIGQRLLEIREVDLAEQAFLQAVRSNPGYAEAWALLSEAQQRSGKDGWPALDQARRLNPESDLVRVELVLYHRREGQIKQALNILQSLADDHPREARWKIEIGGALAETGDLIAAMRSYQEATELEPENADAWRALAAFTAENGFDSQSYSIPAAVKAMELDPDNPQSLDLMGWILLIEGELNQAEQFLQQALEKDGDHPRALLHLAQVYLEMNRLSLAYKPLSQAAAQNDDPSAALQASRLLERYFPSQR
jgi:tetratricopeptide (TPR) repeat protein